MKVSKAMAAANREALLSAAGVLYRQRGFDAVSIAEIGASAGLTHGGLYSHFTSKEALRAETVGDLFEWTAAQVRQADDVNAFLDRYLSRRHVDTPGAGCPLAALGGDTARATNDIKTDFADGLEDLVEAFSDLAGGSRAEAISAIAAMVGAVVLARASGSRKLGDEILATVRTGLATS